MLKAFQLRSARSVCGIGVRDIGMYLGVSGTIISRWEQKLPLDDISSNATNPDALVFFFEQYNILFPTISTISLNEQIIEQESSNLTRFQLRAARAALSINQDKLSELTSVPRTTINYLESQQNTVFLSSTRKPIDDSIFKNFFEHNGIFFPDSRTVLVTRNINL